jgi:hypothetical protein
MLHNLQSSLYIGTKTFNIIPFTATEIIAPKWERGIYLHENWFKIIVKKFKQTGFDVY